jgi:DNA-directed RNA polymerase omega subunit
MPYKTIDDLGKVTRNRYEAVIVAAQHARHLNSKRLARMKQIEEGMTGVDIEARKITMVALNELMEGKVKFVRDESDME